MASRTKQKEEARARRLAEERARVERERRQRRLRMLGGVVLGAVAVVAVLIAVSSGGSSNGLQTGTRLAQTTASVESLLSGIPQSGSRLGNPKAPVTMTYYGDLECPICQEFTLLSFPQLVANDVRSGKVQVVYRAFKTATPDLSTFEAQQSAALAAGQQQHFWDFTELFYHEQGQEASGYVNDSYLTTLARQVPGLNVAQWQSVRTNPSLVNQVVSDEQSGISVGVKGTPTLIFQGPKGAIASPSGVPTYAGLEQLISRVA